LFGDTGREINLKISLFILMMAVSGGVKGKAGH
jgi:hypothetical protein